MTPSVEFSFIRPMNPLLIKDLGQQDYLATLALQERLLAEKQAGQLSDILLLVEHDHVFTTGRGGKEKNLLKAGGVPFIRASRGGDITYHGPGQMVVYPLLDLRSTLRKDVHKYLQNLEWSLIDTLNKLGIPATRIPPWTGIWIRERKIASLGIAVRKGITYHGLALNVTTDLGYFKRIIPCGLTWAEVTSMERELGRSIPLSAVKEVFIDCFMKRFRYKGHQELCHEDIPTGSRLRHPVTFNTSASNGF